MPSRRATDPFARRPNPGDDPMIRTFAPALMALTLLGVAGKAPAEEIRGKVKSVDSDKSTITLTVGEDTRLFRLATDAKVVGLYGKKLKKATVRDVDGGLRGIKEGADVTITTAEADKSSTSQVKVEDLQPKVKKKKKNKNKV